MEKFDYGPKLSDGQFSRHPTIPDRAARPLTRPMRAHYRHIVCQGETWMPSDVAHTIAVDPTYYTHMFCAVCQNYFKVDQFRWNDGSVVGS